MQYNFFIILVFILTINTPSCLAFSTSDDEIYQDLIKLENQGRLPSYITQAKPDKIEEQEKQNTSPLTHIQAVQEFEKHVQIPSNRKPIPEKTKTWYDIVKSVASGNPTAFDVNEIKILTEKNDPKATELLAWMYAKGVGVNKCLKTSWFLYMKAAGLNVENAKENAQMIYKSMSTKDKNELLRY